MSKYNLLDIHEGMGYKEFEDAKEADRLEAHPESAKIKAIQAMMAKEKSVKEGDAVDLAIEASQEKAGIKEDKYDDIVNADDDIPAGKKKAAALAYRKVDKGDSYENATSHIKSNKDKMNEVRIDKEVANKIEGMLSRPLKAQFLDAFDDIWEDLTEDDMFYPEDVINHLNNEMHKRLSLYRTSDPKPEEIPMFMGTRDALDDISIREEDRATRADKMMSGEYNDEDYKDSKRYDDIRDELDIDETSIIRALKVDGNGTKMEIDSYMASVKRSGDEFDDVDDYVEDFKNYVADKSLQEHFKRFR